MVKVKAFVMGSWGFANFRQFCESDYLYWVVLFMVLDMIIMEISEYGMD